MVKCNYLKNIIISRKENINMKYNTPIPIQQDDIRFIIQSFEDGYYEYFEKEKEYPTVTHNGQGAAIWNHIFTQLEKHFKRDGYQVNTIKRGLWEVLYVYDESSRYLYTFMRYNNFVTVQNKNPKDKLFYYGNVLSRLNGKLMGTYEPEYEQLYFFGSDNFIIDEEDDKELQELLNEMISKINGEIELYAIVLVQQEKGKVKEIECKIPIENLNSVYTEAWTEYIGTSYEMIEYKIEVEETQPEETEILVYDKDIDVSAKEEINKEKMKK
jgi:Family of unknown function (DUF5986)